MKRLTAELSGQFEKSKGTIRGDTEESCMIGIMIWNTIVLDRGCFEMNNKEKHLEGTDIILNLDEIDIYNLDSFYSSGCSGSVSFHINCHTKHGYCEDPEFLGKIKVLEANKCDEEGVYLLKIKFEKEDDD